jgi:hypothetical protein
MSYLMMYLFTRIDFVHELLGVFTALGWIAIALFILIGCICFFLYSVGDDQDRKGILNFYKNSNSIVNLKKAFIMTLIAALFFTFLYGAVPNMKEAAVIYLVPKIMNNENIKEMPNNFAEMLNEKIKEWTDDAIKYKKEDLSD